MSDSIPYKTPIIPKNNANTITRENATKKNTSIKRANLNNPSLEIVHSDNDSINRNKLTSQSSKESEASKNINFRKSSSEDSDSFITHNERHEETQVVLSPARDSTLVDLQASPLTRTREVTSDISPNSGAILRKNGSKTMRPLTEYFHSKSIDVHEDYQSLSMVGPDLKFKSVNNLNLQVPEEEDDFTFESYSNSLRRSARNVLAKQLADEASRKRNFQGLQTKKKISLSTDNLALLQNEELISGLPETSVTVSIYNFYIYASIYTCLSFFN